MDISISGLLYNCSMKDLLMHESYKAAGEFSRLRSRKATIETITLRKSFLLNLNTGPRLCLKHDYCKLLATPGGAKYFNSCFPIRGWLRRVGRKGGSQQVKMYPNGKISLSPADSSELPPIRTIIDERGYTAANK